ncbi:MAG: hypothetical protein OJJ54_13570 [Pseudonocardia sp.]|nr:hypothetical protein [Pseudonocardia sp.]
MVSGTTSPGISNAFPGDTENYFFVSMAVFGGLSLYGALQRSVVGLLVERAGLIVLSAIYLGYSVAVVSNSGFRGITPAVFGLAIAVANVARLVQISRDLKRVKASVAAECTADSGQDESR